MCFFPHRVGNGDAVAVQVHREGGDDVGLGAEADGRAERLAGQHMGAVELAVDHAVEQYLPVGLGFERDVEAFVFEETLLVGDGQRRHVGELDEAEFQVGFLSRADRAAACGCGHLGCRFHFRGGFLAATGQGQCQCQGRECQTL
jgi:hypothetical protein